ncbi:agouti signaling protein 1 [Cynoglossus semilaevis]|uniref:Agouti-signaling protein n=1 Tax=Cynoglossus semilaevis TaxID=244447 RepID=A0A3P8WY79_CYNSE|nr:agouti-signaling protein [Cynoglossus semilaevis]
MDTLLLLCCLVLTTSHHLLCSGHMVYVAELSTDKYVQSSTQSQHVQINSPPVVAVELPKSVKNRKGKKQKKNKFKRKPPPPPANCVPLWASCKTAGNVCCDSCAFCKCRLFRTVCFCRMGNPQC